MLKFFNITKNQYFLIGFVVGLLLSLYLPQDIKEEFAECPELATVDSLLNEEFEPELNLAQKPMQAKKVVKNVIRPRYYSSELGIREKLFVGFLTSVENIDTYATSFNKTVADQVKIKYFINADNVKANFKLKNIVGFTDTRENLRPFHVLKYIADNYLADYDYFLLITDASYLNARDLKQKLNHISISFDIYMGRRLENVEENYRNYCDINAGIILSSSVIKKIRANLDWCVRNAVTNFHSLNIGKCVKFAAQIDECQASWQGITITSYKMQTVKLYRDLHSFADDPNFNNASIVYPLVAPNDFYLLHAYFSRRQLERLQHQYQQNELEASKISHGTISNDVLEVKWPLGVPESAPGETRHDIIPWTLMNMTHSFLWDAENNVKRLSEIDADDLKKIVDRTLIEALIKDPSLNYIDLHSAYRKFDPVRGMDYRLHLNFMDQKTKRPVLKSYEVVKPLGLIEIVPSPYVTESTRIAILLPTFKTQIPETLNFIRRYEKLCMENQDNTFLMLVFMYPAEAPSKGEEDIFVELKTLALDLSEKYKSDNSRIAWVSIRLPPEFVDPSPSLDDVSLTSVYGATEILSLAVTDLALRKIGLESLVMICSNSVTFKADFLNRVRMNTIQGFQVFAPIGFMMYPCRFTGLCKECSTCDVGQSAGYFDRKNYDVVSFYSRDYVDARKRMETEIPIVHNDHDIVGLMNRTSASMSVRIVDLFLHPEMPVHVLRAVEPNLRLGLGLQSYLDQQQLAVGAGNVRIPVCQYRNTENYEQCIKYGSRKQIGEAIVMSENER